MRVGALGILSNSIVRINGETAEDANQKRSGITTTRDLWLTRRTMSTVSAFRALRRYFGASHIQDAVRTGIFKKVTPEGSRPGYTARQS